MRKRILTEDDLRDIENDLQGLDLAGRTSTIVIANYDSHENSKKGADIVIEEGENASEKINDAIQSLKGTGGEVKLMEGNYNLEYGIAVNVDGVHLTGVPGATILVQNKNWKNNPYNGGRKIIIDTKSDIDNLEITISNLYLKGASIKSSGGFYASNLTTVKNCIVENSWNDGFYCKDTSIVNNCISINSTRHGFSCNDSSTITNCVSENSGDDGFYCSDSSIIDNCINKNSGGHGFSSGGTSTVTNCVSENSSANGFECERSSTVNNCTSKDSNGTGFYCWDSSNITNCVSENSRNNGLFCPSSFKGVCTFNILKGDRLSDSSSAPAIVEYNIIQEG